MEITEEGLNQVQTVQPKESLLRGRRASSDPSSTVKSSYMFPIQPLHEQYTVNTLYMDLSFLGTQVVNLIQLLCFSPTLWQRKCFLSLKYDKNKFWSPLLCALSVPWCYKKLMANTSVGGVLKILAAHY